VRLSHHWWQEVRLPWVGGFVNVRGRSIHYCALAGIDLPAGMTTQFLAVAPLSPLVRNASEEFHPGRKRGDLHRPKSGPTSLHGRSPTASCFQTTGPREGSPAAVWCEYHVRMGGEGAGYGIFRCSKAVNYSISEPRYWGRGVHGCEMRRLEGTKRPSQRQQSNSKNALYMVRFRLEFGNELKLWSSLFLDFPTFRVRW